MRRIQTNELILCALFVAATVVLSQISIPIGPVPINLAHIATFLAAGLLGARSAALSQAVFVLMGAVGLPVFSGFRGGLERVFGPTGGYIIAYIGCAYLAGYIIQRFGKSPKVLAAAIYAGWAVAYLFGTAWYSYITHTPMGAALMICVVPFLIGDALKTVLIVYLIRVLNPIVHRQGKTAGA